MIHAVVEGFIAKKPHFLPKNAIFTGSDPETAV